MNGLCDYRYRIRKWEAREPEQPSITQTGIIVVLLAICWIAALMH